MAYIAETYGVTQTRQVVFPSTRPSFPLLIWWPFLLTRLNKGAIQVRLRVTPSEEWSLILLNNKINNLFVSIITSRISHQELHAKIISLPVAVWKDPEVFAPFRRVKRQFST